MSIRTDAVTSPMRPGWLRRRVAKWPGLMYRGGLGFLLAGQVTILTTRGRVTKKARRTPLWYIREGDVVYCFSGWGPSSDWFKNLKANPGVLVQIGKEGWHTQGVVVQDTLVVEKVLRRFFDKYGRLVPVFYHLDRLILVVFTIGTQEKRLH